MTIQQRDDALLRLFRVVQWAHQKPCEHTYNLYRLGELLVTEYRDLKAGDISKHLAALEEN